MEWEATEARQRVHHPFPGTLQIRDACGGLPENLYLNACLIKDPNIWVYGSRSVAKPCPALCDPIAKLTLIQPDSSVHITSCSLTSTNSPTSVERFHFEGGKKVKACNDALRVFQSDHKWKRCLFF